MVGFRIPWRRGETFENVLARCLAEIESGKATVESCLAAHPDHAGQLAPALKTALTVRRGLAAQPDPAFVQRARARMLAQASSIRAVTPAPAPVHHTPVDALRALVQRPLWQLSAMAGSTAVFAVALFLGIMIPASADAAPTDWNYGFKRRYEQVRLALAPTKSREQDFRLKLVSERAEEIEALAASGHIDEIEAATNRFKSSVQAATKPLPQPGSDAPPQVTVAQAQKTQTTLAKAANTIETAIARVEAQTPAPAQQPSPTPAGVDPPKPPIVIPPVEQLQSALSAAQQAQQQAAQTVAALVQPVSTPTPAPSASVSPTGPRVTAVAAASATSSATPAVTPSTTPSATPPVSPTPTATATPSPSPTTPRPPTPFVPTPITPGPITSTPVPTVGVAAAQTPVPAATATPFLPPTPARTPPPTPSPTPTVQARPLVLDLMPGVNHFAWFGATQSVDVALSSLAGKYAWVEWTLPGGFPLYYTPGQSTSRPFLLTFGSQVTIYMTPPATVPHGSFWNPDLARPMP